MDEQRRQYGQAGGRGPRRPFQSGRSGPGRTQHQGPRPGNPGSVSRNTGNTPHTPPAGALGHAHTPARVGQDRPHGGVGRGRGGRSSHRARSPEKRLVHHRVSVEESAVIPPIGDAIRIIHLGGVEEVGRNMSLVEYKDDIIVIDLGFQFKEEHAPGIDYILPNTKYLEDRKDKIRAVVVTHGHLDHIGGAPYILGKIGNPKIYARLLTTLMIAKRQEEFPDEPAPNMEVIEKDAVIKISDTMSLRFFAVTHTIPDAMGVIIDTPYGSIVHTGDLKLDHVNGVPTEEEEARFKRFEKERVLLLMTDSTNVERPGFSIPESTVNIIIEKMVKEIPGRIILGSFASQLERAMKIIEFAERHGRKVIVEGRSMKANIAVAEAAGYLKHRKDTVISLEEMDNYPPSKILILATGSQGEEFAALMRIANKAHKHIRLNKDDTVILSSSIVPGNERSVQNLKDRLSRLGAHIVHYQVSDVHSSGHANGDETLWIHKKINPKFFVPVHGYHYMHTVHADIAQKAGIPSSNIIIPDNAMVIEIQDKGARIVALKEKAPSNMVMVDGFSVGDVQHVVLRDRQTLAQDGMFVIVAIVDMNTGRLRKSPDIISRGFVYLRESQELLREARGLVKKTVEQSLAGMHPINFDYVRDKLTDDMSRFLMQRTAKRPIVIPVLLGV
ncbi:MAG: ribonuclease J [Patescibacteria group bacterium]